MALSRPVLLLVCAASVALNVWVLERWPFSPLGGPQDYLVYYVGGSLVGTPQIFDRDAQIAVQERAGLRPAPSFLWMRLPFYALIARPFTRFSYPAGMLLWKLLSLLLVGAAVWATPAPKGWTALAFAVSLPLWATFLLGNDGALMLFLVALFARSYVAGGDLAAGFTLGAIAAAKPHLVPFVFLALLLGRRWKVIGPACLSDGALVAVCFALQGAGWPSRWLQFLATAGVNPDRQYMPNLAGMLLLWDSGRISILAGIAVALWFAWISRRTTELPPALTAAAGMLAAIAVSPHSYTYDYALPLPLLLAAAAKSPESAKWAGCFALPYIYLPLSYGVVVVGPALVVTSVLALLYFAPREFHRARAPYSTMRL